jgi:hypothetical protein
MPTRIRKLNGTNARLAGQLGERACRDVLGLSEPDVEVKTMQLERHKFSVELTQLERQPDKVYVVVAYSRGPRTGTFKGPRKYLVSIADAFKGGLTFALVSTDQLLTLIKEKRFEIRWVEKNYRTKARFVALFRLTDVMETTTPDRLVYNNQIHEVHNSRELVKALSNFVTIKLTGIQSKELQ